MQNEYLSLADQLWNGFEPHRSHADEGPRPVRVPGVRLMTSATYHRPARRARDLFRPHRGRSLAASDLRRAGRPHPRHRARRPRRNARRRWSSWLPAGSARRARARRRLRHRRAGGRSRRGAAPTWSAIDISPTLVELAHERAPRDRRRVASIRASATCSTPRSGSFDYRRRDGQPHPLRGARHRARARRDSARARRHGVLFTVAPRTPALTRDARGRPAVPARRPRAGDRADLDARRCDAMARSTELADWRLGARASRRARLLHLRRRWRRVRS